MADFIVEQCDTPTIVFKTYCEMCQNRITIIAIALLLIVKSMKAALPQMSLPFTSVKAALPQVSLPFSSVKAGLP